jgi:transposase-like protein
VTDSLSTSLGYFYSRSVNRLPSQEFAGSVVEHRCGTAVAQQKQRYLCKDCHRQFIRNYTYLGCIGAWRALIVPMTMNGSGICDISRVLLLSHYRVLKTLREAAAQVAEPAVPRRVSALELDEFSSFVRNKKQRWT